MTVGSAEVQSGNVCRIGSQGDNGAAWRTDLAPGLRGRWDHEHRSSRSESDQLFHFNHSPRAHVRRQVASLEEELARECCPKGQNTDKLPIVLVLAGCRGFCNHGLATCCPIQGSTLWKH